jgi:hypothetical protein
VFKKKDVSVNILTGLFCLLFLAAAQSAELRPAEEILRSFVEDFRSDPAAAEPINPASGAWAGRAMHWWGKKGGAGSFGGIGQDFRHPSAFYTLDLATLRNIESAEIKALTAMGRARASDPAPMDIELMEGFEPEAEFFGRFIPFTFHFWTRGFPEIVSFGRPHSREVHGARMVVFYYQKGLRSAWALIEKAACQPLPQDQTTPLSTLIIGIRERPARSGQRSHHAGRPNGLRSGSVSLKPGTPMTNRR